jgi:hypothetical protein
MPASKLAALSAALLLALGLPLAAGAKEESKIQVPLVDDSSPGNGNGKGRNDGKLHSTFTESQATFQVHAKQLAPDADHAVLAREPAAILPDECQLVDDCVPAEGCELIQEFTTGSNGQVNLKIDLLQTGDATHGPIDPRGKLISICQGSEVVMSSWFYGDAVDDRPHSKVKEQTALEPADQATEGSVSARYSLGPNGKATLNLQLQSVGPGTYSIYVNDELVYLNGSEPAELTTNPAGNAKLSLRTHPGKGKGSGKGHNKKGTLSIDPRRQLIEVKQDDLVVFSGPMLAQIPNLNDCSGAQPTENPMDLDSAPVGSEGWVTTGVNESCDPIFRVAVYGLDVGDYAVVVDHVDFSVGTPLTVVDDPTDGTFGELRYSANPGVDELPLSFEVGSGSLVEVWQGATLFLSVTLP